MRVSPLFCVPFSLLSFFSPEMPDTEANVLPPSYATFTPFRSTFLCNKPDEERRERGVYRVLFLEDICLCDAVNQFKV